MFSAKRVFLTLSAGALLLSTGCLSGNWWKWMTAASELSYNVTGTAWHLGTL